MCLSVLLAEDDPTVRAVTACLLERTFHCRVDAFCDGARALARLQEPDQAVGLLILDVHMPYLGGFELLEAARAMGVAAPALIQSADPTQRITAEELGAEFLLKPWRAHDMIRLLSSFDLVRPCVTPSDSVEPSTRQTV